MIATGVISSIVRELILPPLSLFFMLALGLVLGRRYPRAGRALCVSAVMLLLFLCTGVGARMLVYPLENLTRALPALHGTDAQAIVVLAAGRYTSAPEYGGVDIPDYVALARLRYAAKLYRETGLPVLVSGGNGTSDGRFQPKALAMAAALKNEFAIPVKWIEPNSENTRENALFSARLLKQDKVTRILLVTDAMHMPRSERVFAENGMEVMPAPTIFFSAEPLTLLHLLPSAENLRRSYYALYEWIGLAWYAMRSQAHYH